MITNKYIWFLKIVLKTKLPLGYTKEKVPGGKIIYINEYTDKIHDVHPMSKFFRKTFMKILQAHKDYRDKKEIKQAIVDEVSRLSIQNRIKQEQIRQINEEKIKGSKRKIIFGSSAAVKILNSGIEANENDNKLGCEGKYSYLDPANRSTQRYHKLVSNNLKLFVPFNSNTAKFK